MGQGAISEEAIPDQDPRRLELLLKAGSENESIGLCSINTYPALLA
jgi:hypothetical protein